MSIRGGGMGGRMLPIRTGPGQTTYVSESGSVMVTIRRSAPGGDE